MGLIADAAVVMGDVTGLFIKTLKFTGDWEAKICPPKSSSREPA